MNFIDLIHPTNLEAEREKFFRSHHYHPIFKYDWQPERIAKTFTTPHRYQKLIEAILSQNHDDITQQAADLFDTRLDHAYLALAKSILQHPPEKMSPPSTESVYKDFNEAFEVLGLNEYRLEIVDTMGFNFRPSPSQKKIVMSIHAQFEYYSLQGYIKHELVHLIRYENAKSNSLARSPAYLPTEEGLAGYCQDYTTGKGSSSFQRAGEYAVTEVGLKGSLREMVDFLIEKGFSPELAWQRAARHKYGFQNTQLPGDIMKPAMYFHHQQKVKSLSLADKYRLFMGKIDIAKLAELGSYQGRIPIDVLTEFYQFEE